MALKTSTVVFPLAFACSFGTALRAENAPLNQQQAVSEPFADPIFESVCHLKIRRRVALFFHSTYTGSAVLYRGRYLLTAGHNVYQDRSAIASIEVRCGSANARKAPIDEKVEAWQTIDASGYAGSPFSRDFGVIRLDNEIVVSRPIQLSSSLLEDNIDIQFAGYPGGPHDGWSLFAATGKVTSQAFGVAKYDIETFKSNSGGPVWRNTIDGPELVAIHVTNSGGRIVDGDFRQEVARLISELDRRFEQRGQ